MKKGAGITRLLFGMRPRSRKAVTAEKKGKTSEPDITNRLIA
jgi:hypothetical protein